MSITPFGTLVPDAPANGSSAASGLRPVRANVAIAIPAGGPPMTLRWFRRWGARQDAMLLVLGLALLVAWELSGLDLLVTRSWGTAAGFPWREHWVAAGVMHGGARMLGWAVFAGLLLCLWRPLPFCRDCSHRERLWWVVTTLLCVALIGLLKQFSDTSCPWALSEFGGVARYVPHWLLGVADGGPGRCFPSGHASTALAFIPGWFILRTRSPRMGRLWLLATLSAGAALGAVQVLRGAHYVSHTLWTAWICWAASALSYHACAGWRAGVRPFYRAARGRKADPVGDMPLPLPRPSSQQQPSPP